MDKLRTKFKGLEGVFIQEQSDIGLEIIVIATFDESIGHVCLIGAGGVAVELYKDVAMRIPSFTKDEVMDMLCSLKSYPLLNGFRGSEILDQDGLVDLVVKFGDLIIENPMILDMDINPVAWDKKNEWFLALDCKVRV